MWHLYVPVVCVVVDGIGQVDEDQFSKESVDVAFALSNGVVQLAHFVGHPLCSLSHFLWDYELVH